MKNILALVLMVFGIVGCTSFAPSTKVIEVSHNIEVTSWDYAKYEAHIWQTRVVKNYDDLTVGTDADKAEAMSIETGERFHIGNYPLGFFAGNKHRLQSTLIRNCEELYKSKCVITRTNLGRGRTANDGESFFTFVARDDEDKVYFKDLEDYELRQEQNKRAEEINRQTKIATRKREEEETERRKQNIIIGLTQRCEEYGFTGESNISACIQREAQHDKELAMQRYELEKTRLALQQAQSRTYVQNVTEPVQKEEDLPFLIKFLGDVAIGVADAYADPAFQRDLKLQQQINNLNRQRLLDSINN
jgi:hypothetical protein